MKNPIIPVTIVTVYLFVYAVLAASGADPDIILYLFLISPFLVVAMVIAVLKSERKSTRTFEEYFYEDTDFYQCKV